MAAVAAPFFWPTTSGTTTGLGPLLMVSKTSEPTSTGVPAAGSVLTALPAAILAVVFVFLLTAGHWLLPTRRSAVDSNRDVRQYTAEMLVPDDSLQNTLDLLQNVLGAQPSARITVLQVETYLPKPEPKPREQPDKAAATREGSTRPARHDTRHALNN